MVTGWEGYNQTAWDDLGHSGYKYSQLRRIKQKNIKIEGLYSDICKGLR